MTRDKTILIIHLSLINGVVSEWKHQKHSRNVNKLKKHLRQFIEQERSKSEEDYIYAHNLSLDAWTIAIDAMRKNPEQSSLIGDVDAYQLVGALYEHQQEIVKRVISPKLIGKVVASNKATSLQLKMSASKVAGIVSDVVERIV